MSYLKNQTAVLYGLATSTAIAAMLRMSADANVASMSLADFAEMDTSDVAAVKSLLFPAGIYGVRIQHAIAGQTMPEAGKTDDNGDPLPPLFWIEFKYEILEAAPADKSVDVEKMIGRTLTERFTLWPDQFKEMIGLLKGSRYKLVGLPTDGRLGGVEGAEPGWIDGANDKMILLKVRHKKERAYYDWAPVKGMESEEQIA